MIQVFHAMLPCILILFKCWEFLLVSNSTDWKLLPVGYCYLNLYPHMNCIIVWSLPFWWNLSSISSRHFLNGSSSSKTQSLSWMHFPLAELGIWPSGCFRDFITLYLGIALSFLSRTSPVNTKQLLMIVNIKYSWSFRTVLFEIWGNVFLVIAGTTLFDMFFLGLRSL